MHFVYDGLDGELRDIVVWAVRPRRLEKVETTCRYSHDFINMAMSMGLMILMVVHW